MAADQPNHAPKAVSRAVKLVECPRDAMQGIERPIPTELKTRYINLLLQVGFDTLDFGSFVSPKAIPQLADTPEVIEGLDLAEAHSRTSLLAIVANKKGAEKALEYEEVEYLGFPFSLSETFQQRNTNRSQNQALDDIREILFLCKKHEKQLVVYLSMGFGNPYGEPYHPELLEQWTAKLDRLGVRILSLADTVGIASPEAVAAAFRTLVPAYPAIEFGAHLHARPDAWREKVEAAYEAGCHRFDGALRGFGGCPFAEDTLVGNVATENLVAFFKSKGAKLSIDAKKLEAAQDLALEVFGG